MEKNVSVMCFHDELCQVFNALMTALSLLREGSKPQAGHPWPAALGSIPSPKVTVFFGSRGINAVHREKMKTLTCLPDEPPEVGQAVMKRMDELDLPLLEDLFVALIAEGATVLACPLNLTLFAMAERDLVDGVKVADPAKYYKEVVIPADMNLTF